MDYWSHPPREVFAADGLRGWRINRLLWFQGRFLLDNMLRGDWSEPALCLVDRRPHRAPDPNCTCGFRVCRDEPTVASYIASMHRGPMALAGYIHPNASNRAMIEVEARGEAVFNESPAAQLLALAPTNCLSVTTIRPTGFAYVESEQIARPLRSAYPGFEVVVMPLKDMT